MMEYWVHSCSIWLKNSKPSIRCNALTVTSHQGVVTPGIYINIHGETVKLDPKSLGSNTEVMRF
jgi:hypothetical protein